MIIPKNEGTIPSVEKSRFQVIMFASLHQKATQSTPSELPDPILESPDYFSRNVVRLEEIIR